MVTLSISPSTTSWRGLLIA
ncbi:hypothetical protein VCHC80A1_01213A, partial [Vibrio cholerae HC-80A1]